MINEKMQLEAVEKLSRLKAGALFMEMGTGKTKVALDLIAAKKHKVDYILWICPYSLKNEIESECKKWHPELRLDIVGCESIAQSDRIYLDVFSKVKASNTFIVVDESLKIKNRRAKRTKRIVEMGAYASYRLILNGTPVSRNILDIYTQMEFLSPKILSMSFAEFKDTYCEYYQRGKFKGRVRQAHNVAHLISKIEPYIFDASLSLDRVKYHRTIYYYVDEEEYFATKERLFDQYYDYSEGELNFNAFAIGLQKYYSQCLSKKEELKYLIDKIDGQVIVFVRFLDSIPDGSVKITGDIKDKERGRILERFKRGEFKVLYITYGCGSFGLNLQFCHNTVFAEMIWDYAQLDQAEARTYRIGQNEDVTYHTLVCANSGLENLICDNIAKKGNLLYRVKEEIKNTKGGAEEWVKHI